MGLLERYYPNFEGNIRIDLPDFLKVRDRLLQDFQFLIETYFDGSGPRVLYKYEEATHSGLTFKLKADVRRAFHDGNQKFVFKEPSGTGTTIDVVLAPSATKYIVARVLETKGNLQTRAFWNTDLGVAGEEYFDDINIDKYFEESIVAVDSVLPNDVLLFTAVTDPTSIISSIDNQDLLWHRRPYALPATVNRPTTWENVRDFRGWSDILSAIVKEVKGTNQEIESSPWGTLKMLREHQNMFITGGGDIGFEKNVPSSNLLEWSAPLQIEIAGRPAPYAIAAGSSTILDGECLYVVEPESAPAGNLTVIKSLLIDVPIDPTEAGHALGIIVLFFRRGGTVYGTMDIPELDSGEVEQIGQDLPQKIRDRLGITGENSYEAYGNTAVMEIADSYALVLSKLSQIHQKTFDPIGHVDRTQTTLTFNQGTREVTISPVGVDYEVYLSGGKYALKTAATLDHPDADGLHFFWLSTIGALQTQQYVWTRSLNVPVAIVLWDSVGAKGKLMEERHSIKLTSFQHDYMHRYLNTQYKSGFATSGYTINVASDAAIKFVIGSGTISDEDIELTANDTATPVNPFDQDLSGSKYDIMYMRPTSMAWTWDTNTTGLPIKHLAGVPQLNNPITGVQTPVTDTYFFNVFAFATNFVDGMVVLIQQQKEYINANDAAEEQSPILSSMPSQEFKPLYRYTFQYVLGSGGTTDCKLIGDPLDLRTAKAVGSTATPISTTHNSLSGRSDTAAHPSGSITTDTPQFDQEILTPTEDNAQKAFNKLGTRAKTQALNSRQDKTLKLIEGGDWYWDGSTLSLSANAYLQIGGLLNIRNTILAQSFAVPATHVVYVTFNRSGLSAANLTLLSAAPESVPVNDTTYIIARRSGQNLIVGNDNLKLVPGQVGALGAQETIYTEYIAGENLGDLDSVYVSPGASDGARTAGYVYRTDASNEVRSRRFVGFAPKAVVGGSPINIQEYGRLKGFVAAGKSRTAGAEQFLSATVLGGITESAPVDPNFRVSVGYAKDADTVLAIPVAAYKYSDNTPQPTTLSTGTPGTSTDLSRADHRHGVAVQTSNSITISVPDVNGIQAVLKTQNSNSVNLSIPDTNGLYAAVKTQASTSIAMSVPDANGIMACICYGAEPGAVSTSTSGCAGVANTASRSDHNHDLGAHDHSSSASGGYIAFGTEPSAVSSSTSGCAGVANTASRSDHNHDLGTHNHSGATDGGALSGTYGISITGNAVTATCLATSRNFTVGDTTRAFNGSAAVSWTRAEMGVPRCTANVDLGLDGDEGAIGYVSGVSGVLGQPDGALYTQVYSNVWKHQIYGDYRTGQIAIRGKNNGVWQAWRCVIDSGNISSQSVANANTLGGNSYSSSPAANCIVQRDVNGYINTNYICMTGNIQSTAPYIMAANGGTDWFNRWISLADLKTQIGVPTMTDQPTASTGVCRNANGESCFNRLYVSHTSDVTYQTLCVYRQSNAWNNQITAGYFIGGACANGLCAYTCCGYAVRGCVYAVSMGVAIFSHYTGAPGIGINASANNCGIVAGANATWDFYACGAGGNYGPFTGGHDAWTQDHDLCPGMIISTDGCTLVRWDSVTATYPRIVKASEQNAKAVFGIFATYNTFPESGHIFPEWVEDQMEDMPEDSIPISTASIGEGRMLVVSSDFCNIEAGDLITVSPVPGYAKRQVDDIIRSSTVGKSTQNLNWNDVCECFIHCGTAYKKALLSGVYYSG